MLLEVDRAELEARQERGRLARAGAGLLRRLLDEVLRSDNAFLATHVLAEPQRSGGSDEEENGSNGERRLMSAASHHVWPTFLACGFTTLSFLGT